MGKCISPNEKEIEQLRTPLTEGEKKVLDIFKEKTSDEWEIYVQPHLNGSRPDFILLNPKIGIGVFEVKDWKIKTLSFQNKILNINGKSRTSPNTIIDNYKKNICTLYCPRLNTRYGLAVITTGLIFPNISESELEKYQIKRNLYSKEPFSRYKTLSGNETVTDSNIKKIYPDHNRENSLTMKKEYVQDLKNWFLEPEYSKEQRDTIILDKNQQEIVNSRTETGYKRIRGSAGSGKSIVLVERARKLIEENKHVLFITPNITLQQYLRDLCNRQGGGSQKITWYHFHQWLKETYTNMYLENKAKEIFKKSFEENEDDAVEKFTPKLCELILESPNINLIKKYDAIIVDEGQGIEPLWWKCLRKFLQNDGEMLLTADKNQDLSEKFKKWTDQEMINAGFSGPWTELKITYRLPQNVIPFVKKFAAFDGRFSNHYIPKEDKQQKLGLEICKIKWIQTDNKDIENKCSEELDNIITEDKKGDRSVADLTFICDTEDIGIKVKNIQESKGRKCIHTFDEKIYKNNIDNYRKQKINKLTFMKGAPRVKLTTIHSFKGWEGRLIVLNINRSKSINDIKLIYTALTRVKAHPEKSFLHIICTSSKLQKFAENYNNDENYEFKIL